MPKLLHPVWTPGKKMGLTWSCIIFPVTSTFSIERLNTELQYLSPGAHSKTSMKDLSLYKREAVLFKATNVSDKTHNQRDFNLKILITQIFLGGSGER